MDQTNLWTRRSNARDKPSLSMRDLDGKEGIKLDSPRTFSSRKFGDTSSHGKSNPFNAASPSSAKSPGVGASSAFGLGTGAFASFGQAKSTKPQGAGTASDPSNRDKDRKDQDRERDKSKDKDIDTSAKPSEGSSPTLGSDQAEHSLKNTWNLFYRPPATTRITDYEKSIIQIASIGTVESFWSVYVHLKCPSSLPTVSDYHIFKDGVRPVWEDEANKRGGKWIIRLKKGVADRYWEDLLLAVIGDQFMEASDEVCGAVLSVRSGEDVLSVWTKNDGGRNIKIRETIKRLLAFPPDTNLVWKSHDESIAQKTAVDEARQQKGTTITGPEKRRTTLYSEDAKNKVSS